MNSVNSVNVGKIKQIIGSVLDITFENGQLPEIFNALEIDLVKNGVSEKLLRKFNSI